MPAAGSQLHAQVVKDTAWQQIVAAQSTLVDAWRAAGLDVSVGITANDAAFVPHATILKRRQARRLRRDGVPTGFVPSVRSRAGVRCAGGAALVCTNTCAPP